MLFYSFLGVLFVKCDGNREVYFGAVEQRAKNEIQGSFTSFRMTTFLNTGIDFVQDDEILNRGIDFVQDDDILNRGIDFVQDFEL